MRGDAAMLARAGRICPKHPLELLQNTNNEFWGWEADAKVTLGKGNKYQFQAVALVSREEGAQSGCPVCMGSRIDMFGTAARPKLQWNRTRRASWKKLHPTTARAYCLAVVPSPFWTSNGEPAGHHGSRNSRLAAGW